MEGRRARIFNRLPKAEDLIRNRDKYFITGILTISLAVTGIAFFILGLSEQAENIEQTEAAGVTYYNYTYTFGGTQSGDTLMEITGDSDNNVYTALQLDAFTGQVDLDPTEATELITPQEDLIAFQKYLGGDTYDYTYIIDSPGIDLLHDIDVDENDNLFIFGTISGPGDVDIDPTGGTDNYNVLSDWASIVQKYDNSGNRVWSWEIEVEPFINTDTNVMKIDSQGNIYLGGTFNGVNVDFDPTGTIENHSTNGNYDIFISKYDNDGIYQWTQTAGGIGEDVIRGISVDSTDNVYATGYFESTTMDFDPSGGTDNLNSANGRIFLTSLDSDGNYRWTRNFGGTDGDNLPRDIEHIAGVNHIIGSFEGTADFDGTAGTDNLTSAGSRDAFITEYNTDGSYVETITFGGTGNDHGRELALQDDIIYIGGTFNTDSVDFDLSAGTDIFTSSGQSVFITQYSTAGVYQETVVFAEGGFAILKALFISSNGGVYAGGTYNGSNIDFDPTEGTDLHTSASSDAFFTSLDDSPRPAPTVASIDPDTKSNTLDQTDNLTVNGTGFIDLPDVTITDGITNVDCLNEQFVDSTQVTCEYNPFGLDAGLWDVKITNFDSQSGTGMGLLTITGASSSSSSSTTTTSSSSSTTSSSSSTSSSTSSSLSSSSAQTTTSVSASSVSTQASSLSSTQTASFSTLPITSSLSSTSSESTSSTSTGLPGDNDADGMPNSWEDLYGFNQNNSNDAENDADGDGFSNLQEYQNGTNPLIADFTYLPLTGGEDEQTERQQSFLITYTVPIIFGSLLFIILAVVLLVVVYLRRRKKTSPSAFQPHE